MENAKQQLVDRIKSASNVLVTVGRNPSVDALSALLGLTLVLNKQGKHAAAVFSGQVPSTIEFLEPEETIEKNTDSLRDFIIALDKNKADKLRYKVEDNVVRIFITPYKTSISQEDFEFSEGDFNIDVVIALGVLKQEDLDEAITAHGRILHDATVASINIIPDGGLGSINWYEPQASSLSELVTDLTQMLGADLLDEQIATALLTGIVAETDRFSNDKTSSVAMSMSAALMKAGANQQLVASKLEGQLDVNAAPTIAQESQTGDGNTQQSDGSGDQSFSENDGAIHIDHNESTPPASTSPDSEQPDNSGSEAPLPESEINTNGAAEVNAPPPQDGMVANNLSTGPKLMTEPPTLGGTLTANSTQPDTEPLIDPLSLSNAEANQTSNQNGPTDDVKGPDLPTLPPPSASPPSIPSPSAPSPVVNSYLPPQVPAATPALTPPPPSWTPPPPSPPPTATPASSPPPPPAAPMPAPPAAPTLDAATLGNLEKDDSETLADIEQAVSSTHIKEETVDEAREEVNRAYSDSSVGADEALPAIDALNAQQLGGELHPQDAAGTDSSQPPSATDSTAPPPVPPPIPFQFGNPPPA